MDEDDDAVYSATAKGIIWSELRNNDVTDRVWAALVDYGRRYAAGAGSDTAAVILDEQGGRIVPLDIEPDGNPN